MLLDLHSTQQPSPPMTLPGWPARKVRFARALGWPGLIVRDEAPGRLRDWGGLGAASRMRTGLVVECGQHWLAGTAANAVRAAARLAAHLDLVDRAALSGHEIDAPIVPPRVVTVTHTIRARSDAARLDRIWPDIAEIPRIGTLLGHDGVEEIRTPYDDALLIMPVARPRTGAVMLRIARDDETLCRSARTSRRSGTASMRGRVIRG